MYLKYNGKPWEKHKEHVFSEWWPFSTLNQNDSDRALRKCTLDIQLFQLALKKAHPNVELTRQIYNLL